MRPTACLLGLLALVAGSPAQDRQADYGDDHTEVETLTTYTTVTTCPVTSTWTDGGTYVEFFSGSRVSDTHKEQDVH